MGSSLLPPEIRRSALASPPAFGSLRSDAENRAIAVNPAIGGGSVQVPIRSLNQPCSRILAIRAGRLRAKAVERGQRAAQSDFEDRPAVVSPTYLHDSVQVSVFGLDQWRVQVVAIGTAALRASAIQRSQRATQGKFEDSSRAVRPTHNRGPVQVPIAGLDQSRLRKLAVRATAFRTEAIQRAECAALGDFEDRSISVRAA